MTLETIKEIIQDLPAEDTTAFATWLNHQDMKVWDEQIQTDSSPGGAGLARLNEVDKMIEQDDAESFKVTRPSGGT